jgi:class 3 adenylate cyclase
MSGDVHVAFQVSGAGPVDLVLAPGAVSHLDLDWDWLPRASFLRRIGRFCRLVRFDKRGTGLSDRVTDVATLEERTDDIRAVMDAAGSKRAFIFGLSEGAQMACFFAATYPDRTLGLLTWGGQARWLTADNYPWGITEEAYEAELAEMVKGGVTKSYIEDDGGSAAALQEGLRWQEFLVRYYRAGASPSASVALERMNQHADIRDILPAIRVPTLIMNAVDDPVAHVDAARNMASQIPGARFMAFPGGHRFWLDQTVAEDVAAEIEEFLTGTRTLPDHERFLATVLFTDIVGSTEHLASVGDRVWRERVEAHHDIVRSALERHRGCEIDTAGDGFLATFDGPGRAVACARAIVDEVEPLGIEIRAGLHTGECETINEKVGGIAVHIGARVAALAGPSEILVSSTVKDLTAGSGLSYEDLGERELKGVPDRWRLFRVARR